jgi:hypothetical protein
MYLSAFYIDSFTEMWFHLSERWLSDKVATGTSDLT